MDRQSSGTHPGTGLAPESLDEPVDLGETPVPSGPQTVTTRTGPAPEAGGKADPAACPRCGGALVNPGSLGWCQKCGYCQSLENEAAKELLGERQPRETSALGLTEFWEVVQQTPTWVWVLLGGLMSIVLASLAADNTFPAEESLIRAVWTTAQLAVGLIAVLAAQVWVGFQIVARWEDDIGPKDFILSFRLWSLAIGKLPHTRKPVTLGVWGLTAMLSAVCLIGGLNYWWQFYQPKRVANTSLRSLAQAQADAAARSLEESLNDFANSQDLTKATDPKKNEEANEDKRPTVECVVIGYQLEGDRLGGLVLAMAGDGKLQYAGVVRKGFTEKESQELLKKLATLEQPNPLIASLSIGAIWVRPEVFCEVHQSGAEKDGQLISPKFKALLK